MIYEKKYNLIQVFCFGLMGWFIGIGATIIKGIYKSPEAAIYEGLLYLLAMPFILLGGLIIYFIIKNYGVTIK